MVREVPAHDPRAVGEEVTLYDFRKAGAPVVGALQRNYAIACHVDTMDQKDFGIDWLMTLGDNNDVDPTNVQPCSAANNDLTPLTHWRLAKELTIGQNLNVRCRIDRPSVPNIRFATKFNLNSGTHTRYVSLRYD
nr:hypothetical protein [Sinorhizobium meliloti]